MVRKTVVIPSKPRRIDNNIDENIDKWVMGETKKEEKKETKFENTNTLTGKEKKEARFTVIIPEELYKRMRIKCVSEDISMKDFISALIEKNL